MSKIAFVFPGQGAQYAGMGKDFYENSSTAKAVFDQASAVTGLDIPALCFEENENLNQTKYTQIAMVATEIAILKVLEENRIKPAVTAGLSLGEYAAIVASGAMKQEDAFSVVQMRGTFMQEAVPTGGGMAAVLGLDYQVIEKVLENVEGIVSIANYNCPGQTVITGEADAIARAAEPLKQAGARRVLPLKVSGPFHSEMLTGAGEKLGEVLKDVEVYDFSIPYVANLTADYVREAKEVKPLLIKQVSSPVRFQQSIERMIGDGVDTIVEIGPGKTIAGFVKKINPTVKMINVDKWADLEKCVEELTNA
ncbi:MAG: ACP S-malonyltransferase [Lachnospiraceae bacterium]|nr:ACP S-malonyltransferase [Lachnospiraceae bacterium]